MKPVARPARFYVGLPSDPRKAPRRLTRNCGSVTASKRLGALRANFPKCELFYAVAA